MTEPVEVPEAAQGAQLNASATGSARVYQAGRDLHIRYPAPGTEVHRVQGGQHTAECPYPGLAAFGPENTQWFFGRDALLADLMTRLDASPTSKSPLVIVASSGAGKTSLLQAGLIPALDRGALPAPGSENWPRLLLTPGAEPLAELAAQISGVTGADAAQLRSGLMADPSLAAQALTRAIAADQLPGNGVVLVVDQLEEAFTLCDDEAERTAFFDALGQLSSAEAPRLGLILLSLRADFYRQACAYPALLTALRDNQLPLGPLSDTELRQAIVMPAEAVGLELEPGLVEVLKRDLGGRRATSLPSGGTPGYDPGQLPLLAHALRMTWQQRHGHILTVDGYVTTGGIEHAIATSAEQTFAQLSPAQQELARPLFLRLVKIGNGAADTRRLMPSAELLQGSDEVAADAVIDAFTRARLLTRDLETVEITHEALLRQWPRLSGWISDDRAGRLIRQELEERAGQWEAAGGDRSALYRGRQLDEAVTWEAEAGQAELTKRARTFLTDSKKQQRTLARLRAGAVVGLAVLTLAASSLAGVALVQRHHAIVDRDQATFNELTAEADSLLNTNPSLAAELDATAYRLHHTPSVDTSLISTEAQGLATPLASGPPGFAGMEFASHGRIFVAGQGQLIRLWDTASPERPKLLSALRGIKAGVYAAGLTQDGRTLVAGLGNGTMRMWNVSAPRHPVAIGHPLVITHHPTDEIRFASPALGTSLVVHTRRLFQIWNLGDPTAPRLLGTLHSCAMPNASDWALSPDAKLLAIACTAPNGGKVRLVDISAPAHPRLVGQLSPSNDGYDATTLAFSPNSRMLMTSAFSDLSFLLWNVSDPGSPRKFGPGVDELNDGVNAATFSPGGKVLATADEGGVIQLFNISDPTLPDYLGPAMESRTGPAGNVAFSPDGKTIVGDYENGALLLWNVPSQSLIANGDGSTFGFAFSANGKLLAATNSESAIVDLWQVSRGGLIGPQVQRVCPGSVAEEIAFDPRKPILAVGCSGGSFRLWDVTDPRRLTQVGPALVTNAADTYVNTIAFDHDGKILAAGANGVVSLWNVAQPARAKELSQLSSGPKNRFTLVSINRTGTVLAVAADKSVRLWNISNPSRPTPDGPPLSGMGGDAVHIAFSPRSDLLAAASNDDDVYLWDTAAAERKPAVPLIGHTDVVEFVAFSPDGRYLASGSDDTNIRLWKVTGPDAARPFGQPLVAHPGNVVGVLFSPADQDLLANIGFDDTVYLWNLDPQVAIARICATTRHVLTPAVWRQEVGTIRYDPPCGR